VQFASKPLSLFISSLEQTNGKFSEFLLCLLPFTDVGVYQYRTELVFEKIYLLEECGPGTGIAVQFAS